MLLSSWLKCSCKEEKKINYVCMYESHTKIWNSEDRQLAEAWVTSLGVKNPLLNAGDARDVVWSLGWEDTLEEEMSTHASILDWKIPWKGEPGRLRSMRWQKVGHNWATEHTTHTHTQSKKRGGVWGFRAGDNSWGGSTGGEMLARQKCPTCRQAAQVKKLPLWCSPLGTYPFLI